MKTILSFAAGVSMLALTSIAGAQEPMKLTDSQMDRVTAGAVVVFFGSAVADAYTNGFGNSSVVGASNTLAVSDPTGALSVAAGGPAIPNAYSHADSGLIAQSGYFITPTDKNGASSYESTSAAAQLQ